MDKPDRIAHLNARDDLLAIAHDWPTLATRLAASTGPGPTGMPRPATRTIGLPLNLHVLRLRAEVTTWTRTLVAALIASHTGYTPPRQHDTPTLLTHLATHRLGHFTADPDTGPQFCADAQHYAHTVHAAAYPDGLRTLHTGLPCEAPGCPGTYTVRPTPDGTEPDLVCDHDRTHRQPPAVWARDRWRINHEDGARHLLAAITGRAAS